MYHTFSQLLTWSPL